MRTQQYRLLTVIVAAGLSICSNVYADNPHEIAHGKYLVEISGCNDCHTPGYGQSGAKTPEADWLVGDSLGFRGPWGTTYPANLRQFIGGLTENQWIAKARNLKTRPPMPWWALNAMTDKDLKAIFVYVKSLGVTAHAVPAYVPPGQTPHTAYIQWPAPPKLSKK
jgi:mono/diheme cytochrome c family protein